MSPLQVLNRTKIMHFYQTVIHYFVVICFSVNYTFIVIYQPACIGQRAPDQHMPSSQLLCRPALGPTPALLYGTIWPCQSPAGSGKRSPGCCTLVPPHVGSPDSAKQTTISPSLRNYLCGYLLACNGISTEITTFIFSFAIPDS